MENLSNHSVLRTKFLITFSRNGLRILAEKSLKSKLMALLRLLMRKKARPANNQSLYQKAVQTIAYAYGLTSVSVMDYTYPKRI